MRQIHRQRAGGLSRCIAVGSGRAEPTRRTRPSGGAQARLRFGGEGWTRGVAGGAAAQPLAARLPLSHATAAHSGVHLHRRGIVRRPAAALCGPRRCSRSLPAHRTRSAARSARQPCIARRVQQMQPASCAAAAHNEISTSDLMWSKGDAGVKEQRIGAGMRTCKCCAVLRWWSSVQSAQCSSKPCRQNLVRRDEDPGLW